KGLFDHQREFVVLMAIAQSLLQLGNLHRVLARLADAAAQRPRRNNRLAGVLGVAVERYDMRHLADVLLADRPAAEDTGPMRGPLAVPAVHRWPFQLRLMSAQR